MVGSGVSVGFGAVTVLVTTGAGVSVAVGTGVVVGTGPLQLSQHDSTTAPPRLVQRSAEARGRQRPVTSEPGS